MNTSKKEISFLDVLVRLIPVEGYILMNVTTDIYYKETDSFNYFPFNSSAPNHIPRNISYSITRRIALVVSEDNTRDIQLQELKPRLLRKNIRKISK